MINEEMLRDITAAKNEAALGKDSDSSSVVLGHLFSAGYDIGGATHSGNMLSNLKKNGFVDVTSEVNLETGEGLLDGDILLTPKKMSALVAEDNGESLIQYDNETESVVCCFYYNLPWAYVLRYPKEETIIPETKEAVVASDPEPETAKPTKGTFWGKVVCSTLTLNIRKKPNGTVLLYSAPRGSRQLFEDKDYNGWYKLADGSGYCSAKHIKKI